MGLGVFLFCFPVQGWSQGVENSDSFAEKKYVETLAFFLGGIARSLCWPQLSLVCFHFEVFSGNPYGYPNAKKHNRVVLDRYFESKT